MVDKIIKSEMTQKDKEWWEEEYFDVSNLKDRDWSEGMIKKLLGEPDEWASVDHFRNYTGKRVFKKSRVEKIESSDQFSSMLLRSVQRRKLSQAAKKRLLTTHSLNR